MKSSGAKCTEQTAWILARSPVLSISIHEWNPLSSPFHGFRSCITVEGNLMDGNPLYLVFRVATAERNTPLHHVFFICKRNILRHREIRENGSPVLTSQPTIPRLPPCAVLYQTGSEISRICGPQKRGRKIDREFIFSIFIREQHEDSIKQIKKNLSYTL